MLLLTSVWLHKIQERALPAFRILTTGADKDFQRGIRIFSDMRLHLPGTGYGERR